MRALAREGSRAPVAYTAARAVATRARAFSYARFVSPRHFSYIRPNATPWHEMHASAVAAGKAPAAAGTLAVWHPEHDTCASNIALDTLGVSSASVQRLTKLYERAKFSRLEIDEGMKTDAIDALAGLRAELEPEAARAAA